MTLPPTYCRRCRIDMLSNPDCLVELVSERQQRQGHTVYEYAIVCDCGKWDWLVLTSDVLAAAQLDARAVQRLHVLQTV